MIGIHRVRMQLVRCKRNRSGQIDYHSISFNLPLDHIFHLLFTVVQVSIVVWITKLETELIRSNKVVPTFGLLIGGVIPRWQTGRIYKTPKRVTGEVGSVRVKLASTVICSQVQSRLVEQSDDLNVRRGPHELPTSCQRPVRRKGGLVEIPAQR